MHTVKLTPQQFSALETNGVLECPETDSEHMIAEAVDSDTMTMRFGDARAMWRAVCDISNHVDDLAEIQFRNDAERRKMYRTDARVIANLLTKIGKIPT